ncbi:HupE/UreJ family protein [Lysobacter sp. TAB13]|uniref:HupE/UreJ family protein n=1 Tax=Lysobacter sp. TAB13 TaxID=3233065 RepID=UPI003F9E4CBE
MNADPVRGDGASRRPAAIASACALSLIAVPAWAHSGTGLAGGFVEGFAHPFGGGDHLLAMVGVGLWGTFLGRPLIYLLPVIFPLMMVAGAIAAMFAVPLPPVETGIAVSVLALGACIAFAWRAPAWAAMTIVAVFAVFHGCAHGRELPSAADPIGYSLGFVFATGLLHLLGIGLGEWGRRAGQARAVRIAGAAIAMFGAMYLFRALPV